jgi:hypothetical protein
VIARWISFWDRREGPESLALARILVALVILIDLTSALLLGLVPDLWAPPPTGLGWVGLEATPPPLTRLFGASSATVLVVFVLAYASALLLLAGVVMLPAGALFAIASAELARLATDGERGVDKLLRIAVMVLALSGADARFSLRSLLRARQGLPAIDSVPAWPRQLLFLELVWVYFSAAHNRGGTAWWPAGGFSAISNVLSDPHYARFAPGWAAAVFPLTQLSTAVTMAFELSAPLLVPLTLLDRGALDGGRLGELVRRFRVRFVYLSVGVLLHLGIWLTMRLGIFSLGMLSLYSVLLDPSEVRGVLARIGRAVGRWGGGPGTAADSARP